MCTEREKMKQINKNLRKERQKRKRIYGPEKGIPKC
jgi:hypothetical protein